MNYYISGSKRITNNSIVALEKEEVFVFGTNRAGFHGAGAAGMAMRGSADNSWRDDEMFTRARLSRLGSKDRIGMWAVYGTAVGLMKGMDGMSYGIVTVQKPGMKRSIPLSELKKQIDELCYFAQMNSEYFFLVTRIGTALAGYSVKEIASLFNRKLLPANISLPKEFWAEM